MHPHLARNVSKYLMSRAVLVVELDLKHRIGERLDDRPFQFDSCFFFRQSTQAFLLRHYKTRGLLS